jgi:tetratricopeptide (TPR) repeat protein
MAVLSRGGKFDIRRVVLTGVAVMGLAATLTSCSSGSSSSSSSGSPQSQLAQGIAESRASNYTQAQHLFGAIIANPSASKPLKSLAFYNLGVIHQSIGPLRTTLIDYLNAVRLNPKFTSAWFNLAVAETRVNSQLAVDYYNKILVLKPGDANSLFNSGLILYARGNHAEGASRIKTAIAKVPALAKRVPPTVKLS